MAVKTEKQKLEESLKQKEKENEELKKHNDELKAVQLNLPNGKLVFFPDQKELSKSESLYREIDLKTIGWKYQEELWTLLPEDFKEQFALMFKKNNSIEVYAESLLNLLKGVVFKNLPELIMVLVKAYKLSYDIEQLREGMSAEQMSEILLKQLNKNLYSSAVTASFFDAIKTMVIVALREWLTTTMLGISTENLPNMT